MLFMWPANTHERSLSQEFVFLLAADLSSAGNRTSIRSDVFTVQCHLWAELPAGYSEAQENGWWKTFWDICENAVRLYHVLVLAHFFVVGSSVVRFDSTPEGHCCILCRLLRVSDVLFWHICTNSRQEWTGKQEMITLHDVANVVLAGR